MNKRLIRSIKAHPVRYARALGFTLLTNMAAGMVKTAYVPGEVSRTAESVKDTFCALVKSCLSRLPHPPATERS